MFKTRRTAVAVAKRLIKSLYDVPGDWVDDCCGLRNKLFMVWIDVLDYRYVDRLVVRFDWTEIWFPLFWRLRLRRAVRYAMAQRALDALLKPEVK